MSRQPAGSKRSIRHLIRVHPLKDSMLTLVKFASFEIGLDDAIGLDRATLHERFTRHVRRVKVR